MKVLIFGTGDYYERYKKWFSNQDVLALIDNSLEKQNTKIDGIQVLSPEEGIKLSYDAIVVLSFYIKAMKTQLLELGVPENKIYHFYDLHDLLYNKENKRAIQYYGISEYNILNNKKKILLLSQELTFGGPSIALFHAAEVLIKNGYNVVFASMIDGPLKQRLLKNNIPVIIDENLQIETMNDSNWVKQYSMIFCNTINFHVFLSKRDSSIPVIWWLHDADFFYDGINKITLQKIDKVNLKVVSVGLVPKKAMQKFIPDIKIENLLYGVSDTILNRKKIFLSKKIFFSTIGFLEDIKGQDILLEAILRLSENMRNKIEVLLVGDNNTLFGTRLKRKYQELQEIKFLGRLDRNKLHELLEVTDVLICPSRQDCMPTVAAEAMMHSVPCIVSDVTGTASYIKEKENGFIFENENIEELASKIEWCVQHVERLSEIGKKSRKIYEKNFSMQVFEERLMDLIECNVVQ